MKTQDRQTSSHMALITGVLFVALVGGCAIDPGEESVSEGKDDLASSLPTAPGGVPASASQAEGMRAIIKNNPGARIISASEVELGDGVVVDVPINPHDVQGCPKFWLCLSSDANFGGEQIRFFNCTNENLGNYRMSNGSSWNDKVSSIRNAQAGSNAQARFYNYSGSGSVTDPSNWRFVISLNIGNYLRDLSQDSSADGGNANDKIDIVHVCG
jgi:Peptidase inhibitor family I36